MFQIWQGTKQKDYGLSGTQLQSGIAPWQSAQALVVAASTEFYENRQSHLIFCERYDGFFKRYFQSHS